MQTYLKEIFFTREDVLSKIKELAKWVNEEYRHSKNLVIIGLLKGSIPFIAHMMMDITIDMSIDFIAVSTYNGHIKSSGNVNIVMDLKQDISSKDVLIAEDIIDSGITLKAIIKLLKSRNPKSLKVITLMDKPLGRKVNLQVDKVGFIVPDKFLVGWGLDVKEKMRNLDVIAEFDIDKLNQV